MSATALKSTKRWFSGLNHQNFDFFGLVYKSPTHTGLTCVKTLEPKISSLGPVTTCNTHALRNHLFKIITVILHSKTYFEHVRILLAMLICTYISWATIWYVCAYKQEDFPYVYSGHYRMLWNPLKVPKCETFDLFDFHEFYVIKSL